MEQMQFDFDRFDAIELASCSINEEGDTISRVDGVEEFLDSESKPYGHTLYLHLKTGGVEAVADFNPDEEGAALCRLVAQLLAERNPQFKHDVFDDLIEFKT